MPPVKKCSSPAFSIDRRGGSDENFFAAIWANSRRRVVVVGGGRRHWISTARHGSDASGLWAGGRGPGTVRYTCSEQSGAVAGLRTICCGGGRSGRHSRIDRPAAPPRRYGARLSLTVRHSGGYWGACSGLSGGRRWWPYLGLSRKAGPAGGGRWAARWQGGLERGGCLGWLLVGADNRASAELSTERRGRPNLEGSSKRPRFRPRATA